MKQLLLAALPLLPLVLNAQSPAPVVDLAPIVVAGNPFETRLPSFSTSATRLDAGDIDQREAVHLEDALGMVPNLHFAGATSRPRYLQLRGIGERSQFSGEGPPNFSVGVLMDEIHLSGLAGAVSLFDVQQVDVLRGPQPTLYGSRALAGLMLIQSVPPTPENETRLRLGLGTDDRFEFGVASGGPANDTGDLLYRFTLSGLREDGFRENVFLDRDNTNRKQELHGRFQLLYTPNDETRHHLTLLGVRLNNGYDTFAVTGDGFTTFSDEPGEDTLSLGGASLRSVYRQAEGFDLVSITSGTLAESGYGYDADWGHDAFWAAPPYNFDPAAEGYRYSFTEQLDRRRHQAGQEFRIQGKPGERIFNDRSAWSAGLVFDWLREEDEYLGFSALDSDYEALTLGGYGQLTTRLADGLELVTSLRLENRAADYADSEGVSEDTSDWMAGGRLALEADVHENAHAFIGISRGFKGGGVNANPNLTSTQRIYDPETVWNLETGLRTAWAEGRGRASLTLFHLWRRDLQIGTSIQPDPSDPTTFTFFTDNAAEGTNYGAELDVRTPIGPHASLFGSLGTLQTQFEDYQDAGGNLNVEGRDQAHAPHYTFRIGTAVDWTDHWFTRIELEGKDAFFFSESHDQHSSPYELLHLSLGYRTDSWSLTLWGRNILDKSYDTRGFYFGNEPPDFPAKLWTMKGDPAQFGLTYERTF